MTLISAKYTEYLGTINDMSTMYLLKELSSDAVLHENDYISYKCFNDQESFFDQIRVSKDKKVTLGVYNSKSITFF
jgi:hypothetical protein